MSDFQSVVLGVCLVFIAMFYNLNTISIERENTKQLEIQLQLKDCKQ